jgi:nucleoside-diphosphate-sugar epimerase
MKKRKIAITGATGFLGKVLVNEFSMDKSIEMYLFSTSEKKLKGTFPNVINAFFIETDYSIESLNRSFTNFDTVIHLAAKLPLSENNEDDFSCNSIITKNLSDTCDKMNVKFFINASSQSVYNHKKNNIPFSEDDIPYPVNAYGESKLACEKILEKHTTNVVSLRFGQLFGLGDEKKFFFTQMIDNARAGKPIILWGNGGGGRDYLYIKDAVEIIKIADNKKIGGTYNVGSGTPVSFKELAELCISIVGNKQSPIITDTTKVEDTSVRVMNIEKLKNAYCWEPKFSIEQALTDMKNNFEH